MPLEGVGLGDVKLPVPLMDSPRAPAVGHQGRE